MSKASNATRTDCCITSETTTWEESIKICQRSISSSDFFLYKKNPQENKICQKTPKDFFLTLSQHFY